MMIRRRGIRRLRRWHRRWLRGVRAGLAPLAMTAVLLAASAMAAHVRADSDPSHAAPHWQFVTGGCVAHTPTVVDDTVYIASCNGMVRALDRQTGQILWETVAGPRPYFFHGDPLIVGDLLVIAADNGPPPSDTVASVHAFDRATGKQRWAYSAGRGVAGRLTGSGRWVYAATLEGRLVALDVQSGAVGWSFPIKLFGWEGPSVAAGRVFVGSGTKDGTLYALDADSGHIEWKTPLGASITTSVAVSGTDLYVGTTDGTMHRIDASSGSIQHTLKVDSTLRPRSLPMVVGDTVLVLMGDREENLKALVSLDKDLAGVRWRDAAATRWHTTRLYPAGRAVILGTPSGEVASYCIADGKPTGSTMVPGMVRSIGGSGHVLYVGTTEGTVYAVDSLPSCAA